jgi:lipoteichoic acid synthase
VFFLNNNIEINKPRTKFFEIIITETNYLQLLCTLIFFNTIKITAFNCLMMYTPNIVAIAYKFAYTLLFSSLLFFFMIKIKSKLILTILYIAQSIYIFAYLSYFNYFHSYLHLFQATALLTESVGPITNFSIPLNYSMLILFIDLPFFVFSIIHLNKNFSWSIKEKSFFKHIFFSSLTILMCLESWNLYHEKFILQLGDNYYVNEPDIVARYGTIANNLDDIIFNYGGKSLIKKFQYGKSIYSSTVSDNKPNIIAIQVESMDSSVINMQYQGQYIAPYLHSLAEKNIYYPYTLSYHKAGGTSDSEFSVINSIEPLSNFPSIKLSTYDYPNSFVKPLVENGYTALAFHGNDGDFYSRNEAYSKMGFNEFQDINKLGLTNDGWGAPDDKVFQAAFDKLKTQTLPFFSYIITMSSHMPFTSVSNYYNNSNYDNINKTVVKNYFNSISYVDKSIESFITQVKSTMPNTYILIWGDHAPDIDYVEYRQATLTNESKYFEYVPLIIITPDNKSYKEEKTVASFLDISPTILKLSGIKYNIFSDGVNLIDPENENSKIPFKEKLYDAKELFKDINKKMEVVSKK